jgi:hypothetical protein
MTSATVLTGVFALLATSTLGTTASSDTGAKSLTGS